MEGGCRRGSSKTVVRNADEGEPGCLKIAILDYDPFAVIEGMTLAAYATVQRGFLYLRYEYPETAAHFQQAIDAAYAANLLGKRFSAKISTLLYIAAVPCLYLR